MNTHSDEVSSGERFRFGDNWYAFLKTVNEERILEAMSSLKTMLAVDDLSGLRFLDIGSGSGLFSLAARRMGAKVHSFDYDDQSVECAKELKRRYFTDDSGWIIEQGSVLDAHYLSALGQFDVVYSWGVLHHTGNMFEALKNAMMPISEGGRLFIAIYNDQDIASRFWLRVKKAYCSSSLMRFLVIITFFPLFTIQAILIGLIKHRNPLGKFIEYRRNRGMSIYHDWIDWLGGLPFEVAKPEEILNFYMPHGFVLENLITTNRLGCNQFVFRKQLESRIS